LLYELNEKLSSSSCFTLGDYESYFTYFYSSSLAFLAVSGIVVASKTKLMLIKFYDGAIPCVFDFYTN